MAQADSVRLDELLAELNANDPGLQALLDSLGTREPKVGLTDPDDVPPLAETTIKAGDLFSLGEHRLLCGNATSPQDVARLLNGAEPTLLATDPPYGVALDPTWRDGVYNGLDRSAPGGMHVKQLAERPYMMGNGAGGHLTLRTPHGRPVALMGAPPAIATRRSRATREPTGPRHSPWCHPSKSAMSGTLESMRPR